MWRALLNSFFIHLRTIIKSDVFYAALFDVGVKTFEELLLLFSPISSNLAILSFLESPFLFDLADYSVSTRFSISETGLWTAVNLIISSPPFFLGDIIGDYLKGDLIPLPFFLFC